MNAFPMLARYNRWANRTAYAAAADLSDTDYRADCGAAFASIHGTLNHLVVTDRIWMYRFTGRPYPQAALDATACDDFAGLKAVREALDEEIVAWVEGLSDAELAATISYVRATTPEKITQPLAPGLLHLFNHQTHHRGQVHAMLTRLTGQAPPFDLLYYQREAGEGV
ncbi:DinB family protein [Acuticoccus sediminis]|uniref:DinB family protein n=1 Tax=Acuticoccus sediminis TaxID=2184697 RepID=UPI001CFC596E|nr:DinB family protein [Acuticoccus sediminis]